jgi:predicted transcriptional regulator
MQSSQQAREVRLGAQEGVKSAPKPSHAKNRGRIDVMADVLNCCRSPASKSHIMLFANVNSIVATRMIENLTQTGLLDSIHEEDSIVYVATPKGAGFVQKYIELAHLISPELMPAESKTNNPNRLNSLNF